MGPTVLYFLLLNCRLDPATIPLGSNVLAVVKQLSRNDSVATSFSHAKKFDRNPLTTSRQLDSVIVVNPRLSEVSIDQTGGYHFSRTLIGSSDTVYPRILTSRRNFQNGSSVCHCHGRGNSSNERRSYSCKHKYHLFV